jgi:hypothetical protein
LALGHEWSYYFKKFKIIFTNFKKIHEFFSGCTQCLSHKCARYQF